MAGNEVASGYVSIIAQMPGVKSTIAKELGDAGDAGGKSASKGFASGFGGAMGSVVKIGAGAVAAVGGLLGGLALKGGIDRALNIEQAQAKLSGLGHSADAVAGIMKDATAAVKGTAFVLGDAATVAASAVAAGIKPGQDLERNLKLVGDAATIAGTGMGDMGAIFNKVASTNKVQGEVLAQLGDRGIPILQLLSQELGVSAEEVAKLARDGKIDFATFQNAMEAGMGGAALKSGETFRGALANTRAALSRIGETAAVPVLSILKDVFNALIPLFDKANAALKPMAAAFSETLGPKISAMLTGGLGKLPDVFSRIGDTAGKIKEFLSPLFDGFNTLTGAIGGLLAGSLGPLLSKLPMVGGLFSGITGPVGLVVGAIAGMIAQSAPLRDAIGASLTAVFEALGGVMEQLAPVFEQVSTTLMAGLAEAGDSLAPVIAQIADVFANLLPLAADLVSAVLPPLAALFTTLVASVVPLIQPLMDLVTSLMPPLIQVFNAVIPVVAQLIGVLAPLVATIASMLIPIIAALLPVVTTVFTAVANIITAAMQIVQGIIQVVTGIISGNWSQVWTGIQNIFSGIWNTIKAIVQGAFAYVQSVITFYLNAIQSIWSGIWGKIGGFLTDMWEGAKRTVSDGINNVMGFIGGLKDKVIGALAGAGSWLVDTGRNIINGLLDGAGSLLRNIGSFFLDMVPGWIRGPFEAALGIHSPSRVFAAYGKNIGQGLINGVEGMHGAIGRTMDGLVTVPDAPHWSGTANLVGAASHAAPVFVQNPFTGEYLLARTSDVADARIGAAGSDFRDRRLGARR